MPAILTFFIHNMATFFMFAVICFVQFVHYPLFRQVSIHSFPAYEKTHQRRISYLVVPPMCIEVLTGITLFFIFPFDNRPKWLFLLSLLFLLGIWCITILLMIPLHQKLTQGKDNKLIEKLLRINLLRTVLWTARVIILLFVMYSLL